MIELFMTKDEWKGSNWIKGIVDNKYKFCAKVFEEPSIFGINKGKVSKLQVNTNVNEDSWGFKNCIINYDRGWDIKPKTEEANKVLDEIINFWDSLAWKQEDDEDDMDDDLLLFFLMCK